MIVKGTFEVAMTPEPAYEETEGVTLGRASLEKTFAGPLQGTSRAHMLGARTPFPNSAAYVALERFEGTLEGKPGSFAIVHMGLMARGTPTLIVHIVPDSGTGELLGIAGHMSIEIVEKQHFYELHYELGA